MDSARPSPGLNTIPVSDLGDPRLEPYRNQKDAWLRAQRCGGTGLGEGMFLAEGELVVRTLLRSAHRTISVLCTPARLLAMHDAFAALPSDVPVFVADRPVLERIVGFDLHRGVLALGRRRESPSAADLAARAGVLVVCEDLANHDNLGAVFRNTACLAGGLDRDRVGVPAAVLLSPRCCDPLYRKALRVSMGHALRVPFATVEAWPEGLGLLAERGFDLLALTPEAGATPVREFRRNPNKRPAVLVGAEGPGLSRAALAHVAHAVRIPMAGGADSLNVATALAVALSHLREEPRPVGEPAAAGPSQ